MATVTSQKQAPAQNPTGVHGVVVQSAVGLLGVGLFALLAGVSPRMGNIMVSVMAGFVLIWLLLHTQQLSQITGKL